MPRTSDRAWRVFEELTAAFDAGGEGGTAHAGQGWFASLSNTPNGELNVCGLTARADRQSADELIDLLGADQPAIVFTSGALTAAARAPLLGAGFELAETAEPLMRCGQPPAVAAAPFRVAPATRESDVELAIDVTAEAHRVDRSLLAASIGIGARSDGREVWLAWDGEEAVSALWLAREGGTIGVMEMMTPKRHQRRGAGRCLLTGALTATWDATIAEAVLLATPAGRGLYESVGFVAVDEALTCVRGLDDDVLGAIGQATSRHGPVRGR